MTHDDPKLQALGQAIHSFEKKLAAEKDKDPPPPSQQTEKMGYGGLGVGIEFIANIMLPPVAGYFLDGWLGTKPWIFLLFLLMGFVAGFYFLYRLSINAGAAVGFSSLQKQKEPIKNGGQKDL